MGAQKHRHLEWDGCFNVRDLGGLRTSDGRMTRCGRVVRADALSDMTGAGWAAMADYGVRTVIDLRNDDEVGSDAAPRPESVTTVHLPLDASEEREFWDVWSSGPQFGTPLYFRPHLERFPERTAAVVSAISRAEPGGVVFHCVGGRDRTGQVTMVLLVLVGVAPEEIAADYVLSAGRLREKYGSRGEADQGPLFEEFLAARGTTAEEVVLSTTADLDAEAILREAGLSAADLEAHRRRMLDPG